MVRLSHITKFPSRRVYRGFKSKDDALQFTDIFSGSVMKGLHQEYFVLI